MELKHPIFHLNDLSSLWQSTIGLEKESLRLKQDGTLSDSPHSAEWGTRTQQPYIQTDFADSQLELITPPVKSAKEAIKWLAASHQIVQSTMTEQHDDELLWPFSGPALLPDDPAVIKIAQLDKPEEYQYRAYLAEVYGKPVQLLCGIHYNFQINPALIEAKVSEFNQNLSIKEVTNDLYLTLGRNYLRYRWLLTYFLGATPYLADNYSTNLFGSPKETTMRSFRQSQFGYQNDPDLSISYASLEAFVTDVENAVTSGQLSLEKELYRDVRFRGQDQYRQLITDGIKYIEFRNFDLNPLDPYGMTHEDIIFTKLFILTMLYVPQIERDEDVEMGNIMNHVIAATDSLAPLTYQEEGRELLTAMQTIARTLDEQQLNDHFFENLVTEKFPVLEAPELTLGGKLVLDIDEKAKANGVEAKDYFLTYGLNLARQHKEVYLDRSYNLHGFENYEISTQHVLKHAMKAGIEIEELDPSENLIKLTYNGHSELVKNANMTAFDTQISYFVMENKVATKKILAEQGIQVPAGESFTSFEAAAQYYPLIQFEQFVVKPKNTNYGIGISIFKAHPSRENYEEALEIAFAEDETILIEAFVKGTELRFYVQNGEVHAICERQPAQVKGDGQSSVAELIDRVNEDPLRGDNHRSPLVNIGKGRLEQLQLNGQNLTLESIPDQGQVVYLRENSNISTGGIAIDRTDEVHHDYKDLAIRSAEALAANFCGVDLIIKDFLQPIQSTDDYAAIEANFNPAMMIHLFPGIGKPRLLGIPALQQLFPEAPVS